MLRPSMWMLKVLGLSVSPKDGAGTPLYTKIYRFVAFSVIAGGTAVYLAGALSTRMALMAEGFCNKSIDDITYTIICVKFLLFYILLHAIMAFKGQSAMWDAFVHLPNSKFNGRILLKQFAFLACVVLLAVGAAVSHRIWRMYEVPAELRRNHTDYLSMAITLTANASYTLTMLTVSMYYVFLYGMLMAMSNAIDCFHKDFDGHFANGNPLNDNYYSVLKAFCSQHMQLCFASAKLNEPVAMVLLSALAFQLPLVTMLAYALIKSATDLDNPFEAVNLVLMVLLIMVSEQPVLFAAAKLNEQLHAFEVTLMKVSPTNGVDDAVERLVEGHLARAQSNHWGITCGYVFTVTYSSLLTIFSVVLTYLTILLQFNLPPCDSDV